MRAVRVCGLWGLIGIMLLTGCVSKRVRQADAMVVRGRYTEALEIYRRAQSTDPNSRKLETRLKRAKQLEGERLRGMADIRLAAGDSVRAFELYGDATRYDPTSEQAREGLVKARDQWLQQALDLENEGKFGEAAAIHDRLLREFRKFPPSLEALARMNDNSADKYLAAAAAYRERQKPGNALIELLRARQLKPGDPALEKEIAACLDSLRQTLVSDANIFARAKSRIIGPPWSAYLNERLKTAGIPITTAPGHGEGAYQIELSGLYGPLERHVEKIQVPLQFANGFTSRPNPEYEPLKRQVDDAEARVRQLEPPVFEAQTRLNELERDRERRSEVASPEEEAQRKKLAEVSRPLKAATEQYQKLSSQLARIPEVFQDLVTAKVTYPADQVTASLKLTGEIVVSARDGQELQRLPLNETAIAVDQTHPLLKASSPRPEIPIDPLVLPSESELRAKAESQAMSRLGDALEALYHNRATEKMSEARRLAVAGKVEDAVESFLVAYMSDPKQSPDEAVRYILDAKRALGLPLLEVLQAPVQTHQTTARD